MNCFRLITNCFFSVKNLRWRRSRTEIGNLFILEWIPVDPHHQLHQQLIVVVMINTLTRSAWLMICLQQRCSIIIIIIIIVIINSNWRLVLDPKFYKNSLRSENNSNKTRNQRVFELRDFPHDAVYSSFVRCHILLKIIACVQIDLLIVEMLRIFYLN